MAALQGRYSYRSLLLATCLGLALGSGALFTAISWRLQRRAAIQLEDTRVQLALLQVNRRVQVLLSQAIELNRSAAQEIDVDRLTSADFDSLGARFLPLLRQAGDVNYVGVALAGSAESLFLVRFPDDSVALREARITAGRRVIREYAAPPGRRLRYIRDLPPDTYDARTRPFFRVAAAAGRPAWTPSYDFFEGTRETRPGVSYVTPLYTRRGSLTAVVDSDIDTRTLSSFLARLHDRFAGDVFVLEERSDGSRRLIAHPYPAVMLDATGTRLWRTVRMVPDSAVQAIDRLLDLPFRDMSDRTDTPLRFATGRARFSGAFTLPVGRDRPNWLVAVTLPESVALADLRRSQRNALLMMAALALLTVVVAGWLSRRLSKPIEALVRDAGEIDGQRRASMVPSGGPEEIMRLAQVYEGLLERARTHRDELAALNRELRTSNEALQGEIEGRHAATSRSESLELQLLQSQKFEAIGTMAGGIAHDFNNILMAILGSTEVLRHDLRPGSPEAESVQTIGAAAERARDLVQQILAFSRRDAPARRRVRAANLIEEAATLLRASSPARVRVTTDPAPDGDFTLVDPGQLLQVLLNLGTNAIHAMAGTGGELRLGVAREGPESAAYPAAGLAQGDFVEIVVSDDGHGISAERIGRIFDPFFTTKPAGEGTGLGLSIAYGIVQAHGGAITVTSRVGEGTQFHVFLPKAPQ